MSEPKRIRIPSPRVTENREQFHDANVIENRARAKEAFGFGGWQIEYRTSRKAKKREDDELRYAGVKGRREREARATPPRPCPGCGATVKLDPYQRGPKREWCSKRCYTRVNMRSVRAGTNEHRKELWLVRLALFGITKSCRAMARRGARR